ncbi:hypothetical protein BJ742DRAFT_715374 [Cladochytrium replicatum]|nr:hypothetical protein BJ742DRAFT_715374 [Cladochytrium replicatum]
MLPLSLVNTAQGHPVLLELKTGETYNGHLVNCDNWMNINLKGVIVTAPDGERFWKLPEVYIRGATIKYLRIPDAVVDTVREDQYRNRQGGGGRGGGGGHQGVGNRGRGGAGPGGYRGGGRGGGLDRGRGRGGR